MTIFVTFIHPPLSFIRNILLLLAFSAPLSSQEFRYTPLFIQPDTASFTRLSFERQLSTFLWNAGVNYSATTAGVNTSIRQSFRSRLIKTTPKTAQDEYNGFIRSSASVTDWMNGIVQIQNSIMKDNRSDLGRTSQHQFTAGVEYHPFTEIALRTLGGYESNSQERFEDNGALVLFEARGEQLRFEDFSGAFSSHYQYSNIYPRQPTSSLLSAGVKRSFGKSASDSLSVNYSTIKRDFYVGNTVVKGSSRPRIFSREAYDLNVSDMIEYEPLDGFGVHLHGGVSNRTIERSLSDKDFDAEPNTQLDTRIQELELFGTLSGQFMITDKVRGELMLSYNEREERHSVIEDTRIRNDLLRIQRDNALRLENFSRRTTLGARSTAALSYSHLLTFIGTASILRYDTPDPSNTDDRDELTFNAGVRHQWILNQDLSMTITGDVRLFHLVYLSALQSANNNWNRVISFSPSTVATPFKWLRTSNSAEVLANYTAFDYEELSGAVKSYSYRQVSWTDSTIIELTKKVSFEFGGNVRIYERGFLKWRDFKEKPLNSFLEQTFVPRLIYYHNMRMRLGFGMRYFSQVRYRYDGTRKIFERKFSTLGPTASLEWSADGHNWVSIAGWRETQMQDKRVLQTVSNLEVRIYYSF